MTIKLLVEQTSIHYGIFSMGKEPSPQPNHLFVYVNSSSNDHHVIRNNQQLPISIIKSKKFDMRYCLSTELYNYKLVNEFESANAPYSFLVEVCFQVSISDPFKFVSHLIQDVELMLHSRLKPAIQSFCSAKEIKEYVIAKQEFAQNIKRLNISEELMQYGIKADYIISDLSLTEKSKVLFAKVSKDTTRKDIEDNRVTQTITGIEADAKINEAEFMLVMEKFTEFKQLHGENMALAFIKNKYPKHYNDIKEIADERLKSLQALIDRGYSPEQAIILLDGNSSTQGTSPLLETKQKASNTNVFSESNYLEDEN